MACRTWWRNCDSRADVEIQDIDGIKDGISPLPPNVSRIRELISSLEMCHHKADRWVHNIIEAIGSEHTAKGLGTRSPGQIHPVEQAWQNACSVLDGWCAGRSVAVVDLPIGTVPAFQLLARIGPQTELKKWQVQRVIERIREFIGGAYSKENASMGYVPILECGSDYESAHRTECPEYYREHADYWQQTVETLVCDIDDGKAAQLSLAIAIDMLMPCHWNFAQNLEIVLSAIGGDLTPPKPFAACARNIKLSPLRDRMKSVCQTLDAFCGFEHRANDVDENLLGLLGNVCETKKWLAASLDKTIRLQLDL